MDRIIAKEQLKDTFPYLDNITVAGSNQEEHDYNVAAFLKVVSKRKILHLININQYSHLLPSTFLDI